MDLQRNATIVIQTPLDASMNDSANRHDRDETVENEPSKHDTKQTCDRPKGNHAVTNLSKYGPEHE